MLLDVINHVRMHVVLCKIAGQDMWIRPWILIYETNSRLVDEISWNTNHGMAVMVFDGNKTTFRTTEPERNKITKNVLSNHD